ncbi:MAG: GNAT family N-acetyltransferase [Trueperaceae bacterium]
MKIKSLTADEARAFLPQLVELLRDGVNSGAAMGFLAPLSVQEAESYWLEVIEALKAPYRVLLVVLENNQVIGSTQLDLANKSNGLHRAEAMKVMVHTAYRRKGIGLILMQEIEKKAKEHNRTTLVLDTREGDVAEDLYLKAGFVRSGVIPNFAKSSDGSLHATIVMYKLI